MTLPSSGSNNPSSHCVMKKALQLAKKKKKTIYCSFPLECYKMRPHSHDSMCVYMSLNKASLKGNTACTMETEVAMERMLFSE